MSNAEQTQPSPAAFPAPDSSLWKIPGLIVIMLVVIACVWPAMHALPFSDDVPQLEKSSRFTHWTEVFQPDAFNFFRPVKNAIFMAAVPLQKNNFAMHWIALAAYLAGIVGIHRITTIFLNSNRAAWLATCAWALSPTCASTAIWLSCANISIGLVFAAGVFHFHEKSKGELRIGAMICCLIFYALSLLCYEAMIAIPGLLFIRDFHQKRLGFDKKTIIRYALFTAVAIGFMILRHQFSAKSIAGNDFHTGFAPDTKAWHLSVSAPWFLWRHFMMWFFPFGSLELLGSYGWMRSASAAALGFGWVFLFTLLAAAAVIWKRAPIISCGLLIFFVASIPAGNFLPSFNGPINDAYLTIPSIGLAIAFAAVCEIVIAAWLKRKREMDTGIPALIAILVILIAYRLPACGIYFRHWAGVWADPIKMVLLMSESRPFQFQSKAYASSLLFTEGYFVPAEEIANEVLKEAPWAQHAKVTLARVAVYRKEIDKAEELYRAVLASDNLAANLKSSATIELAETLSGIKERREDSAILCREALKDPNTGYPIHLRAVRLLAQIYIDQGQRDKARATLERGLTYHPNDESLKQLLASLTSAAPAGNH